MGIGPAYPAWKAGVLPLNYTDMGGTSNRTSDDAACSMGRARHRGNVSLTIGGKGNGWTLVAIQSPSTVIGRLRPIWSR